jgi:hypothetical protein
VGFSAGAGTAGNAESTTANPRFRRVGLMYFVYASDISTLDSGELGARWDADLHRDQKVHMPILRTYVPPQLLLKIKKRKQAAIGIL